MDAGVRRVCALARLGTAVVVAVVSLGSAATALAQGGGANSGAIAWSARSAC